MVHNMEADSPGNIDFDTYHLYTHQQLKHCGSISSSIETMISQPHQFVVRIQEFGTGGELRKLPTYTKCSTEMSCYYHQRLCI